MREAGAPEPEDAVPQDAVPEEFRAASPEPVIATCGQSKWDALSWAAFLAALVVFEIVQLVESLLRGRYGESTVIAALVCIAVRWGYSFAWRRPYRVELTRTTVRWRSLFRRIEVPLLSVRRVHLAWSRNKAKKLVVDGPRPGRTRDLPLHELHDIDPFLAALTAAAPGIEVRVSPLSVQRRL